MYAHRNFRSILVAVLAWLAGTGICARAENLPDTTRLYAALTKTFKSHYPEIVTSLHGHRIHFEYHTRKFMVHRALKTGEWQEAAETVGPNRGGIIADVELLPGAYMGAAVVPQTFDEHYFNVFLAAPQCRKRNCYLLARLSYPERINMEFFQEYSRLVNDFEKLID